MKKNFLGGIGILLIIGVVFGGNLRYLGDWSTAELVGFNLGSLLIILGGGYLAYWGLGMKKNKKENIGKSQPDKKL